MSRDDSTLRATLEPISNFRPQVRNANKHNQRGLRALDEAMSQDGYVAPMTACADGSQWSENGSAT